MRRLELRRGALSSSASLLIVIALVACSGNGGADNESEGGSMASHTGGTSAAGAAQGGVSSAQGGASASAGGSNPSGGMLAGGAAGASTGNSGGSSAGGSSSGGNAAGGVSAGGNGTATGGNGAGGRANNGGRANDAGATGMGGVAGGAQGGAAQGGVAQGGKASGGASGAGAGGRGGTSAGGSAGANIAGAAGNAGNNCPFTGHVGYTLAKSANPSSAEQNAYALITTAMDKATQYYNCYTNITKSISVSYVPSVATADGNINGSLRFGSNTTYMDYRTAMHEISHTVGIGQASNWASFITNGLFTGSNANAQLQAINATLPTPADTQLHADTQHFWPYGINQQSEVKSEADLINHCKMVMAIRKDLGLQ